MPYVHRVVYSWDKLGCVAHCKQVNFRAQINELDDRIALVLVFKVAYFSGVKISITTSEVKKVPIIYFAKVKGVSEVKARIYCFS